MTSRRNFTVFASNRLLFLILRLIRSYYYRAAKHQERISRPQERQNGINASAGYNRTNGINSTSRTNGINEEQSYSRDTARSHSLGRHEYNGERFGARQTIQIQTRDRSAYARIGKS